MLLHAKLDQPLDFQEWKGSIIAQLISIFQQGVGEPALCLASSVHFGIQDAIQSARADAGKTGVFSLDAPATADRIRRACGELTFL